MGRVSLEIGFERPRKYLRNRRRIQLLIDRRANRKQPEQGSAAKAPGLLLGLVKKRAQPRSSGIGRQSQPHQRHWRTRTCKAGSPVERENARLRSSATKGVQCNRQGSESYNFALQEKAFVFYGRCAGRLVTQPATYLHFRGGFDVEEDTGG